MARPIKETPILYGEDARRFEARMKERRRISAEERARINADYELVLGMLKRDLPIHNITPLLTN